MPYLTSTVISLILSKNIASGRNVTAAMGGASVIAIVATLMAAQTSPAMATGNCTSNVTGYCAGPISLGSGTFSNSGTISGSVGVTNSGSIGSVINSGAIYGTIRDGIENSGTIDSLSNNSGGSIDSLYYRGIWNKGSIGTLSNGGTISGTSGIGNTTAASTIGSLTNQGVIKGGWAGITNMTLGGGALIESITNSETGTISGPTVGIYNGAGSYYGSIGTITNLGVIHGGSVDISNVTSAGAIGTLINGQGGNGSLPAQTHLTYTGNLPGTYLEYVTSSTHYGQLAVTSGTGTIGSFGIAVGSTLANGTYASVLSGVGTIGTISGLNGSIVGSISGGGTWELLNISSDVWDLIISGLISGPDAVNTLLELGYTRDDILKALRNRAAVMNNALNHDCLTFDKNGVCIGFNARYSSMDDMHEGAGVMTAAMRLSPNTHLGVFVDYAGKPNTQGAVAYGDEMPMFGGFVGYTEKPNGTGLQAHLSAAYHTGDVTITRPDTLENTEAGSGKTSLTNWAVGAELGYGFAMSKQSNLTPYIGLRYGTAEMAGYTEGSSEAVSYPISYNAFSQRLTTGAAGLRLNGMLNDKVSYQLSGGIEYDIQSNANAFSGSSTIPDLTTFSIQNTADANRLRGNASLALGYAIAPNQKLTTSVSVRGEAYSDEADTNVMAGYEIGF